MDESDEFYEYGSLIKKKLGLKKNKQVFWTKNLTRMN